MQLCGRTCHVLELKGEGYDIDRLEWLDEVQIAQNVDLTNVNPVG